MKLINKLIEKKISSIVRATIIDWPFEFGIETAVMNEVDGDYHEFGVFKGRSFIKAATNFKKLLPAKRFEPMNFWAYDSFEGLPETNDPTAPAHFHKGSFTASEQSFLNNVRTAGVNMEKVKTVRGFYDKSLTQEKAREVFKKRKIAMTYIDCDIYESAAPIFDFITPGLQMGSVIVIDDWVRHHAHPNHGMQRAYYEWLEKNPGIAMYQVALSKRILFVVNKI
jgi:hypothetical protein